MAKKRARKNIVKDLDAWFSKYIRLLYLDEKDGLVPCYTCGRKYDFKKIQCGHFQSRKNYATRWNEDNARPQCYGCNVMQQGKQWDFGINLNREKEGLAELMAEEAKKTVKYLDYELEELIKFYKKAATDLAEIKGVIL